MNRMPRLIKNQVFQLLSIVCESISLLALVSVATLAQGGKMPTYPDHKLGPFSASHRFVEIRNTSGKCDCHHRYIPKRTIKAYLETGRTFPLYAKDTVSLAASYEGQYDGKKGKWIDIFASYKRGDSYPSAYVFSGDLIDIEKAARVADEASWKAEREQREAERKASFMGILPYIGFCIGLILLYVLLKRTRKPYHTAFVSSLSQPRSTDYYPTSYFNNSGGNVSTATLADNSNLAISQFEQAKQRAYQNEQIERSIEINYLVCNGDLNDYNVQLRIEELRRDQGLGY